MERGAAPGSRRGAFRAAILGAPVVTTPYPDKTRNMIDTQRLIALVVFSMSSLMLWDAWQKHNAPKPIPAPVSASAPAGVPKPTTVAPSSATGATAPAV